MKATRPDDRVGQIARLAAEGHVKRALSLACDNPSSNRDLLNAKGVCLMRLGQFSEALNLFRSLALRPGCIWTREDLPNYIKTNFATALLLGGHPSGCLAVLSETPGPSNPSAQRLRAAIRQWERQLPLWHRLNWWVGRIEPFGRPVTLDFEPGEFADAGAVRELPTPASSVPASSVPANPVPANPVPAPVQATPVSHFTDRNNAIVSSR